MKTQQAVFRIATVGWDHALVDGLLDAVAASCDIRFLHVMHPRYVRAEWTDLASRADVHFFREHLRQQMPDADLQLLASLERADVPTLHNMILGDRVVRKIRYDDALRYASFLARRLIDVFREFQPNVIVGGFDSIHGGLALAVARYLEIPWFALHFSVIPAGLACFCDRLSPAARVRMTIRPHAELRGLAETSLQKFEKRAIQAPAYIAPPPAPLSRRIRRIPARFSALVRTLRRSRLREHLQFTEGPGLHEASTALKHLYSRGQARRAIDSIPTLADPPAAPYVLFGLHYQPESSIDVWAPFFSNQMWVIELLSRSIPPSHRLLVKIHKSDIASYSSAQLSRMRSFPGVELVRPFADTRGFIENADVIVSIQGTMGLEAALLGKPVISLGESPIAVFPSVSRIGDIRCLPQLIRSKLAESRPSRSEIIDAYATYLAPFIRASHNDWRMKIDREALDGYQRLFDALRRYVVEGSSSEDSSILSRAVT